MWKLMLPKLRHLVFLLIGSLSVYALIYFLATTGEAYEYGRHFVMEDRRVANVTGRLHHQRLGFWSGFSSSLGDSDGEASLTVHVRGDRGTFDVPLELRKRQGRWSVVGAKAISERGETVVIVE